MGNPRGNARLRRLNAVRVLDTLRTGFEPATLTELAAMTGLSRASVETLVGELEDRSIVRTTTATTIGRGRPARRYQLRADAAILVGIDIGAHRILVHAADLSGTLLGRGERTTAPQVPARDRLASTVSAVRDSLRPASATTCPPPVRRIQVGTAGIVDREGNVRRSGAIQHWDDAPIRDVLAAAFPGATVEVDNDVRLAALAEQRAGEESRADDVVHVHLGSRTAAAIVIGGRPHRGRDGAAAEIGYLPAPTISPVDDPSGPAHQAVAATMTAAENGDRAAVAAVEDYLDRVADRVVLLTDTVAPEAVVLGGGLTRHGDLVLAPLVERLRTRLDPGITVSAAVHDTDGVACGAVIAALDAYDSTSLLDATDP